jgi:uncharacterized protein YeaO (DUF488 family)
MPKITMLTLKEQIIINKWVQNIEPTTNLVYWFESSDVGGKSQILRHLVDLCKLQQARLFIRNALRFWE